MNPTAKALAACLILLPATTSTAHAQAALNTFLGVTTQLLVNEINRSNAQQPRTSGTTPQQQQVAAQAREYRREIQRRLNFLGYDAGVVDGIFGRRTELAIARFQSDIGSSPTGRITENEISQLYAMTAPGAVPRSGGAISAVPAPQFPSGIGGQGPTPAAPTFPTIGGSIAPTPEMSGTAIGSQTPGFPVFGGAGNQAPSAPGFPALGSPHETAPSNSGFPALGVEASAAPAMTAFPMIGGEGDSEPDAGPAFPTLGGEQMALADSENFPTLNQEEPSADEPSNFPVVGGAEFADDTPENVFPTLVEDAPVVDEGSDYSGLGLPVPAGSAPEAGTFPSIDIDGNATTPPDQVTPEQIAAIYSSRDASHFTLEALLAAMPYGGVDNQPRIFGIALGDVIEEASAKLLERGFEFCNHSGSIRQIASCARTLDALTETVVLYGGTEATVERMTRSVQFNTPVAVDGLSEQLRAPYPELLKDRLVSIDSCTQVEMDVLTGADWSELEALAKTSPRVAQAALNCPVVFTLQLPNRPTVSSFELHFADLTSYLQSAFAEVEAQRALQNERMTAVTRQLDF